MLLNLSRQEDLLTQEQSHAERVMENTCQARQNSSHPGTVLSSGEVNSPAAAPVDPQLIARRVYELMKQDLLIDHERRGPGR